MWYDLQRTFLNFIMFVYLGYKKGKDTPCFYDL
jgi:hypothetical protein